MRWFLSFAMLWMVPLDLMAGPRGCSESDLQFGKTALGLRAAYAERAGGRYCDGEVFVLSSGDVDVVSFHFGAARATPIIAPTSIDISRVFKSMDGVPDELLLSSTSLSSKGNYKLDALLSRARPTVELGRDSAFAKLAIAADQVGWLVSYESSQWGRILVPPVVGGADKPLVLLLRTSGRLASLSLAISKPDNGAPALKALVFVTGLGNGSITVADISEIPKGMYKLQLTAIAPDGQRLEQRPRIMRIP